MQKELFAILLSISPISELRGGIAYAATAGINPIKAFFICTAFNLLVPFLVFGFLVSLHNLLMKIKLYERAFKKKIKAIDKKIQTYEKKHKTFGYLALTLFTAVPLPHTGAYTASLIAWLLGLNKTKSIAAISIGVIIAGVIMTILVYVFSFFIS